ncbi:unnamed protein product [Rodentolepis nana]|uniref:Secreted protein n=1 Tax=Rodentolepis nana TaxID=102285 RepID=A0A0R3U072_RODNA|nr:unnamed protein product [Rodentolepis nana]
MTWRLLSALIVSSNTVGLKEPGHPPVKHSFHKFSQHECEEDGYETGLPDFVENRHMVSLAVGPILIRHSG